jgi:hypothetical protein
VVDGAVVLRTVASRHVPETALLPQSTDDTAGELSVAGGWNIGALLKPAPAKRTHGAFALVGADLELFPWASAHVLLDSGELRAGASYEPSVDAGLTSDGRPLAEAGRSTAFVRELGIELGTRSLVLGLGRKRRTLAHGIIYDDYSTGLSIEANLDEPLALPIRASGSASLLGPLLELSGSSSSLWTLRLAYEPSLFQSVEVFVASLRDRDGLLDEPLRSVGAEWILAALGQDPELVQGLLDLLFISGSPTNGKVHYVGAAWDLLPVAGLRLRGAATVCRGDLRMGALGQLMELRLSGWAGAAEASYGLTPSLGISAFGFALSGDQPFGPRRSRVGYGGFVGPAPYWTWTSLFFSGGLSQGFFAGRATAAGINGHGVAGGGLGLQAGGESGSAELRIAYLRAMRQAPPAPLGGGGLGYGIEADLYGEYWITKWLAVGAEVDVLRTGSFFAEPALAWRVIGQAHAFWGS